MAGAGHVAGARRELARLANDPLRLGQFPDDVERAREHFAGIDGKPGEDVPIRFRPGRARPSRRLPDATRPAQGNAPAERCVEIRREIEPAGGDLTRLCAPQHRLRISLLDRDLVLELQRVEVGPARPGVQRSHAAGACRETVRRRDRLARQPGTLRRALLEPEPDLAVVCPLLELEHFIGHSYLPASGEELARIPHPGERVRRL